jgi:crotonobetainyl-CoA:carnitine CoA-transferase CaiB-like acyl-CoA transferase
VATADVVHHNMTKGTATKLGLDYPACKAVKPEIVYCNTYAYGLEGPLSHFGGLDPLYQASAGLEHEAGAVPHGHDPLYYRFGMCDTANAMLSVVGVLTALYHQRRTGEGQELWTSLMDGGAVFASDTLLRADGTPEFRPKLDDAQRGFAPGYRLYETQDGWIQIVALRDEHWDAFCRAAGVVEGHEHAPDRDAVEPQLEDAMRARPSVVWQCVLDEAGVPNEIPFDPQGGTLALFDADVERLGMVADYEHPLLGAMRQFGNVIDFSETPGRIAGPPPRVGEHTRPILEELGYTGTEMDELKASGVVTWPDADYPWPW